MTGQSNYWPALHPIAAARFQRVNLWPGETDNDGLTDTWETLTLGNTAATPAAAGRSSAIQRSTDPTGWTTERTIPAAPNGSAIEHPLGDQTRGFRRDVTPAP